MLNSKRDKVMTYHVAVDEGGQTLVERVVYHSFSESL